MQVGLEFFPGLALICIHCSEKNVRVQLNKFDFMVHLDRYHLPQHYRILFMLGGGEGGGGQLVPDYCSQHHKYKLQIILCMFCVPVCCMGVWQAVSQEYWGEITNMGCSHSNWMSKISDNTIYLWFLTSHNWYHIMKKYISLIS